MHVPRIRAEVPADHAAIREILIAAFANHPYSRQTEHHIVEGLREAGALALALVAEIDGSVVGHIAFSPVAIDGQDHGWLALGPLAVAPSRQRGGIGKALVEEGMRIVGDRGAAGCVLVGEPSYYRRFGFENHPGLRMKGVPSEYLLALPLANQVPSGILTHHRAFGLETDD